MPSLEGHSRQFLPLTALVLLCSHSQPVSGFGSLFGWPPSSSNSGGNGGPSAQITRSSSILGIEEVSSTEQKAKLHLQLEYTTDSTVSELGWLVPLPARPTQVLLGSALLFDSLDKKTRPSFSLDVLNATEVAALPENPLYASSTKNISYCSQSMLEEHCSASHSPADLREGLFPVADEGDGKGGENDNGPPLRQQPPGLTAINVAGYLNYVILDTTKDIVDWLDFIHYVDMSDENNGLREYWTSLLDPYVEHGGVVMAIQLANPANSTQGTTQPIMIEYDLPQNNNAGTSAAVVERKYGGASSVHRLPYQLSAETAAKDATFDVYVLNDSMVYVNGKQVETGHRRAIPVNYLDVELDEAFVDWMGCYGAKNEVDCLQKNYEDRFLHVTRTVHNQSLVTDYAGPMDVDGLMSLSVREGMTIVLAASGNWLSFLMNLQAEGVPPIPLVLQILDQYIPAATYEIQDDNDDTSESSLLLLDACSRLEHLYSVTDTSPSLRECFDLYTPSSESWTFDAKALAAELDNRVFQPSRRARNWMRQFHYLTRMFGRLDGAKVDRGGSDPYLALSSGKPNVRSDYSAVAAPICQSGDPIAWEISVEQSLSSISSLFWQVGELATCPIWEPTLDSPLVDGPVSATTINRSMAAAVNAWSVNSLDGDIQVERNPETGEFDQKAIENASRFGNAQLDDALQAEAAALGFGSGSLNNGKDEAGSLQQSSAVCTVVRYCGFALACAVFALL